MKALKFILAAGLLGLLAACGGGGTTPSVASITVTPPSASIGVGKTAQFTAVAKDSSGTPMSGVAFSWQSSNTNIATIDPSSGVATGKAEGVTHITATANGVTSNIATLIVFSSPNQKEVATITVSPASASVKIGATEQFTAVAKDSSGNTLSGIIFAWQSSNTSIATIDPNSGVATGKEAGTTHITAMANGVTSNIATLTVTSSGGGGGSVASITVSPDSPSISQGSTQQFTAVAKDAGGSTLSGITFTWSSSDTSVATVDPSSGLATGVAAGSTTITASAGGKSGTATLTVVGQGNGDFSISVAPTAPSVAQGGSSSVTVSVSRYANNVGNVQLSLTGNLPSGLTGSFNPNPETGSGSTLTLTAGASTTKGTYNLFVKGQSSNDTETTALTVTVTESHDTLLVDQDGSSNNDGSDSNLSTSDSLFQTLLTSAGVGYDVYIAPSDGNGPNASQLEKYTRVVWYMGNNYGGHVLTSTDKLSLQAYLNQSGKELLLFYSEYPYDNGAGWTDTNGDDLFANYIGAAGGVEDPYSNAKGTGLNHQSYPVAGVSGAVTAGDSYNIQQDTPLQTYTSVINPASGTDTLLTVSADPDGDGTDQTVAIITGRKSVGTAGSSKVIYSGLTFENIFETGSADTNKLQLLNQLLSY